MNEHDINTVAETKNRREHDLVTAELDGQAGFVAWASGKPGVRTTGETRWEAVSALADYLDGVER